MTHLLRSDLGGTPPTAPGQCVLSLLLLSDVQVMDTVSPARCEWVELLAAEPKWQALLHMHRPYEALTHWALAAHVDRARRDPYGPWSRRQYDLALSLGDNIDNAQHNELDAFLAIIARGKTRLSAWGGVQDPASVTGGGLWPYWCPDPQVGDQWKPLGYPAIPDFVQRASAELDSPGLGFAWACLPGNHDLMRQGTALPEPAIERIAVGLHKLLLRPAAFDPADPLTRFVDAPAEFSSGGRARVVPSNTRRALSKQEWIAAHVRHGGAGYTVRQAEPGDTDAVIDTEHARIVLLDTNHPAGDYQGSVGAAQLDWLEQQLAEVDQQPGRFAILASHHGSVSLTNRRGNGSPRHHAKALTALLHRHPCLVAWLVGHRHLHEIRAHAGPCGGFWEISTGSLIDWPSQARSVEFLRHGDGQLELVCTLHDHGAPAGTLAHWHHLLARRFAGDQCARMQGRADDGDVRLLRRFGGKH